MKTLAPKLFQRSFEDLVELGRARLPSLAPDWTDHNAHDPGITVMELLAWVAEAQQYALSKNRRDERLAYAALVGLRAEGRKSAHGVIWRDASDARSPAATFGQSVVIPDDAVIHVIDVENPTFRPIGKLLWVPGSITRLETRRAGRVVADHTAINERGGPAFAPFGEQAGPRDTLSITFLCRGTYGLFGESRDAAKGAAWAIGVRAAAPSTDASTERSSSRRPSLTATLVTADARIPLEIVSDTTEGFLTTGALLLNLDPVATAMGEITVELASPRGFARPPRALRIEPSVVPIRQGRSIAREEYVSKGEPDWTIDLAEPTLRFAADGEPVRLEVLEKATASAWSRRERLEECGPDERVYAVDGEIGRITFGNGINGMVPPAESHAFVDYDVSDGAAGDVARNRKWSVAGFSGPFGVNPDPVTGGAGPPGWIEQRRKARRRLREHHALVSTADIIEATGQLPLLEIARAWVPPVAETTPRTGMVRLVALRRRPSDGEPPTPPETARWLEAIRRRLAPRMPLGSRLVVASPRYVEFFFRTALQASPGRDPVSIERDVTKVLRERLSVLRRQPGVPVTKRDLGAWIRGVDGVQRVVELRLIAATGASAEEIEVPAAGLPRCDFQRSKIKVDRMRPGTTP